MNQKESVSERGIFILDKFETKKKTDEVNVENSRI